MAADMVPKYKMKDSLSLEALIPYFPTIFSVLPMEKLTSNMKSSTVLDIL